MLLNSIIFNFSKHKMSVRCLLCYRETHCYIFIKNNKGPNTDPCGTPRKTDFQFETSPSTYNMLSSGNHIFYIQLIVLTPSPWVFNLSSNVLMWHFVESFLKI